MPGIGIHRRTTTGVVLLAACVLGLAGCTGAGPALTAAAPQNSATREYFRMVFFLSDARSAFAAAVLRGARDRAKELHVDLDVVDARRDGALQARQMHDAITSGSYVGGFVLPVAPELLCDVSTDLAPAHNFMTVVAAAPICGRGEKEGADTWAPGTLAFVSAGREIGAYTRWAEYIRADNPGRQRVLLVTGRDTAGFPGNADAALHAVAARHPGFDIAAVLHLDPTAPGLGDRLRQFLATHPGPTIVACTEPELTMAAVTALAALGRGQTRVYDRGASSAVLPLVARGAVRMTMPAFPESVGATAIQALYDARIGTTPLIHFYPDGNAPAEDMPGPRPPSFLTAANLTRFVAAHRNEY